MSNLISNITEAQVVRLFSSPLVNQRLASPIGADVRAVALSRRGDTYRVSGSNGDFIVRFPREASRLAALYREERIGRGLRGRVTLRLPDTQVVDDLEGIPPFAIHRMIPGEPLTTETYSQSAPPVRERLVGDLARFFRETHAIPLETACGWLDIPFDEELAARSKPSWFDPAAVRAMRPPLDEDLAHLFEDTVRRFETLPVDPGCLVFGHGDIHGYNVAVGQDERGPKVIGFFDLECAGILDIHEDLFRLSLVSEELLEDVIAAYQALPGPDRPIDRGRIVLYYRAFLFYLMVGQTEEGLAHLKRLVRRHPDHGPDHEVGLP